MKHITLALYVMCLVGGVAEAQSLTVHHLSEMNGPHEYRTAMADIASEKGVRHVALAVCTDDWDCESLGQKLFELNSLCSEVSVVVIGPRRRTVLGWPSGIGPVKDPYLTGNPDLVLVYIPPAGRESQMGHRVLPVPHVLTPERVAQVLCPSIFRIIGK